MKRIDVTLTLLIVAFLLLPFIARKSFANGFIIGEQDAEAMGAGGAFAARADNPSAIFYNPAGITQLDGINVKLGTTLVTVQTTYDKPGGGDKSSNKDRVDTPLYFYLTGKINEKFSAGFGFYQPYGLASDWQSNWPGRHIVTYALLRTYFFNPVFAWKPTEKLSVAFGVIGAYSDINLNSRLSYRKIAEANGTTLPKGFLEGVEGHSRLRGDGGGAGVNAGFLYRINNKVKFGLSYRSPVRIRYFGRAEFRKADSSLSPLVAVVNALNYNSDVASKITMPPQLLAGISFAPNEKLTLEFDIDWRGWSQFDTIRIRFKDKRVNRVDLNANWKDTITYRVGMDYKLNDNVSLRAGYAYDPSCIKNNRLDPLVPDSDKHAITVGFGYRWKKWTFDISNMALFFETASTHTAKAGFNNMFDFDAKYRTFANLTSISLSYKF